MGFAWYDAASFEGLRARMPDMSDSYDDWLLGARKDLRQHEKQGYRIIRIAIRPAEFFPWCQQRGVLAPGVRDRRQYAADGARQVLRAERGVAKRGFGLF